MNRLLWSATVALGLILCSTHAAVEAGGALIETTAPLADHSEESVKAAVVAADERADREEERAAQ